MFSCQSTANYYCDEPAMTDYTECWSYDQNPPITNNETFSYVGLPEMGNNPTVWPSSHDLAHTERNISVEAIHFSEASFLQQSPIQYTPLTPEPVSYPVFNLPRPHQNNTLMAKRHRAMITFVPTKTGNFKAIVKRKRKRTVFTTEQIEALETIFKRKQYVTREDREEIVNQLSLNDKAVKIWFQNRRLKDKKGPEQIDEEQGNEIFFAERYTPDIARIEDVESKINEKTDEYGYVTLDDGLMKDLFNVIDDVLTNKPTDFLLRGGTENSSSPLYEPISPASASDSNDEESASYWQPSEPNESLQRLFDLQTMLSL